MTQPDSKSIARLLAGRLIERRDVKAVQHPNGSYAPDRTPITLAELVEHVNEKQTFGHYLVSAENKCRIFAFDIDLAALAKTPEGQEYSPRAVWAGSPSPARSMLGMQMATMAEELARRTATILDIQVTVSYSGSKGMHVIGLLDPGTTAEDARSLGTTVLDSFDGDFELYKGKNFYRHKIVWEALELELFPKQEEVRAGDGLGNLLRLPLGINLKTGNRSFFLDLSEPATRFVKLDPVEALTRGSF